MKRLLLSIAVLVGVVVVVMVCMPNLRQSLLGVRLQHHLQVGRVEGVTTVAQILCGREIRPLSEDGMVLPNETVNPDVYDVRLSTQEAVQSVGFEEVVNYSVDAIASEQFGSQGANKMVGNEYRLRLDPCGLPIACDREKGEQSRIISDLCFTQIMGAWWPGFSKERLRQGDSWKSCWIVPVVCDVLDGKVVPLKHEIEYYLDDVESGKGMNVAVLTYKGTISAGEVEKLPDNTEVEAVGTIAGKSYINVTTGQTVAADEREIWSLVVRLLDQDMEVVQFADRNSRTYRPRLLPRGDAGFDVKANKPATDVKGMPTAGQLMPEEKGK